MKPLFKSDLNEILEHSREDLLALKGARIFITGGTGFFGKWILETLMHARVQLLDSDLKITVLTRSPKKSQELFQNSFSVESIQWWEGDIRTFSFPSGHFSHIIHAATPARASINDESPNEMLGITALGTGRALEFAKHSSATRFLLTSSGAVYGSQPSELYGIPEDHAGFIDPMDPKNAYAVGKLFSEHACRLAATPHLNCLIARCLSLIHI